MTPPASGLTFELRIHLFWRGGRCRICSEGEPLTRLGRDGASRGGDANTFSPLL